MGPDTFFFPLVALIQALIPLGLKAVAEALEAEVTDLAASGTAGLGDSQGRCGGAGKRALCTFWIRRCQSVTGG